MIWHMGQLWAAGSPAFWLLAAAYGYLLVTAVRLSVVDVRSHRLPNRILFPSYAVAAALLLAAAAAQGDWPAMVRTVAGAASLYCGYFLLRFAYPPGLGFGDVKLAFLLGLYLGHAGWAHLLWGSAAAFVLGGLVSLVLLALRRVTVRSHVAFGPFMLAGAVTALAAVPV